MNTDSKFCLSFYQYYFTQLSAWVTNTKICNFLISSIFRTWCVSVEEEEDNYIKMVSRVVAGCEHSFKCMRIFKRTDNILELQEGSPTNYQSAACSPTSFDEKLMIYTTLFKACLLNWLLKPNSIELAKLTLKVDEFIILI